MQKVDLLQRYGKADAADVAKEWKAFYDNGDKHCSHGPKCKHGAKCQVGKRTQQKHVLRVSLKPNGGDGDNGSSSAVRLLISARS